jgi:hypothetical protein
VTPGFDALAVELEGLFARGVDTPIEDASFEALALRVFAHQYEANATYRAFCEGRGAGPGTVERWQEIPAVPARAFRHVDLASAAGPPEATFLTSGTTGAPGAPGGARARGRHPVPRLSLYRASLRPTFAAHLLPAGERLRFLSLIPPPARVPDSSLSTMIGDAGETFAASVTWLADPVTGPDLEAFLGAAAEVVAEGRPALVAGTAFAFVHLLDGLAADGGRVRLPDGSRIMETGGFKGRTRSVSREELHAGIDERLGVPAHRVVNEYGMTELLSQLYEPVLRVGPEGHGRHVPPPWLRVRALDPGSLEPLAAGQPGLLVFLDLANAGSVSHVLTEDVGSVAEDGVRLRGRTRDAEPRGCSLALEELLATREQGGPRT